VTQEDPQRPSSFVVWLLAARPKTLVAGVVPVSVGSALAWRAGAFEALPALAALLGAMFIQIGTNLANDAFDFKRGADTSARQGPPRATQRGWLSPSAVLAGAAICFGAATAVGVYLVAVAGIPILLVGLVSIAAGYAYTGGPYPLAYHGLGDLFVLVFFGLVAVGGTFFVQARTLTPTALWAGVPVGLLGVALLAVNNTRDVDTDTAARKRTLVVRWGVGFGRAEYVACLALSAVIPIVLAVSGATSSWALLALLSAPLAARPLARVMTQRGPPLNQALAETARLQLVYGLLFAAGLAQ
jgi:1,4-dihydroxy-2-naphthoate polyprenyltransferase